MARCLCYGLAVSVSGVVSHRSKAKESKGVWWMPWLQEAMKDVISCDKPRVDANDL